MKQYINPNSKDWGGLLERPTANYKDLEPLVEQVFLDVKSKGDQALIDYTLEFDKQNYLLLVLSLTPMIVKKFQFPPT